MGHVGGLNKVFLFGYIKAYFCLLGLSAFEVPNEERPEIYFPDLAQCLKNLDTDSPVIISKEFDLQIAQANERVARSEQGFKIGVNAYGQSIHEDRPNEDFYHRYRVLNQIYIKKPIFHWGALQAEEEISLLNKRLAKYNLERRKRSLCGELRAMYLELIVLNYRTQLSNEQLKIAQQNIKSAEERLNVGLVIPMLLEEAQAEKIKRRILLSEIEITLQRKTSQFVSLSGFSSPLNLAIPEKFWQFCLNHQPNTAFPILVAAINSEELESLNSKILIEDQRVIISDAELKPKINLTSAYFQDQVDSIESGRNLDRNNFLIGLEANWAIWDSQKSIAQKKAALARKSKFLHSVKTKTRELREYLDSMIKELESLKERIVLGRKLITVAENRLEKSTMELKLKRISSQQHFLSIVALDTAKISNLEAICKYMVLLDQYEQAVSSE